MKYRAPQPSSRAGPAARGRPRDGAPVDGDRLALADVRVDVAEFRRLAADAEAGLAPGAALLRRPAGADAPELDAWLRDRRTELGGVAPGRAGAFCTRPTRRRAGRAGRSSGCGACSPTIRCRSSSTAGHPPSRRARGARGGARRVRRAAARCSRAELGLLPMAETEALVASLRGTPGAGRASTGSPPAHGHCFPTSCPSSAAPPKRRGWRRPGEAIARYSSAASAASASRVWRSSFAAAHGPYATVACHASDAACPMPRWPGCSDAARGGRGAADAWWRSELARVVPDLGPAPPPWHDDTQQMRFFAACADAWLELAVRQLRGGAGRRPAPRRRRQHRGVATSPSGCTRPPAVVATCHA